MIKKLFEKITYSLKKFKNSCIFSFKTTFTIPWEIRKKIIIKRLILFPFVIILAYLTVSYLDFVLLKMSYATFFSDSWLVIPDWIDFPIDEEPLYYEFANQYSLCIVGLGGGFVLYYFITILFYEVQLFVNRYIMFILLCIYLYFAINDPDILLFHLIYYMGSILCWGSYFWNWFFYWGWNYYQWAIDLEEEMEEDEELEDIAEEIAREGNISKAGWVKFFWKKSTYEHLLKQEVIVKDNPNVQRMRIKRMFNSIWDAITHLNSEISRSWDVQGADTASEVSDKIYGTSPVQTEDRYKKHLYKYHWEALFIEEARTRMENIDFKDLVHTCREDYTDPDDLYIHESDWMQEYEDMEKWRLFHIYANYSEVSDILLYHVYKYKPWFSKPNVIGKYSFYTRRFSEIVYNKIIYKYYIISNGKTAIRRFIRRVLDFFPLRKFFSIITILKNLIKRVLLVWFYFKRSWKIKRTVKRLNSKADRKKKIEDPFFYKTKNINF